MLRPLKVVAIGDRIEVLKSQSLGPSRNEIVKARQNTLKISQLGRLLKSHSVLSVPLCSFPMMGSGERVTVRLPLQLSSSLQQPTRNSWPLASEEWQKKGRSFGSSRCAGRQR